MSKTIFGKSDSNAVVVKIPAEKKEMFDYLIAHLDIAIAVVNTVGEKAVTQLNAEKPCNFREKGNDAFNCRCIAKVEGEEIKTLEQCRNCIFRERKQ